MGKKFMSVEISWTELHTKTIKLEKPVEEGTHDADDVFGMAEDWADVGGRDSCHHYEIHEKTLTEEVKDEQNDGNEQTNY